MTWPSALIYTACLKMTSLERVGEHLRHTPLECVETTANSLVAAAEKRMRDVIRDDSESG